VQAALDSIPLIRGIAGGSDEDLQDLRVERRVMTLAEQTWAAFGLID